MTEQTLVKKFKQDHYETANAKVLAEDHGIRIRQTQQSRRVGAWELATSYFYRSQQSTTRLFHELQDFASGHGFRLQAVETWGSKIVGPVTSDHLCYAFAEWPKDSWASVLVKFIEL